MGEPGWGALASDFVHHFGWTAALLAGFGVLLWIVIFKSDVVKRLLVDRAKVRVDEREQTWDEAQDLIRSLREELDRLRFMRTEDAKVLAASVMDVADLRVQLRTALQTIASEQRGNAGMRHAVRNLLQAYGGMRDLYRKAGLQPPPFREMKSLLDVGLDPNSELWMFEEDGS